VRSWPLRGPATSTRVVLDPMSIAAHSIEAAPSCQNPRTSDSNELHIEFTGISRRNPGRA
ncbi:MAG: hypothetical protein ACRDL3_07065, partial [Solirubrobacterales bacterium]